MLAGWEDQNNREHKELLCLPPFCGKGGGSTGTTAAVHVCQARSAFFNHTDIHNHPHTPALGSEIVHKRPVWVLKHTHFVSTRDPWNGQWFCLTGSHGFGQLSLLHLSSQIHQTYEDGHLSPCYQYTRRKYIQWSGRTKFQCCECKSNGCHLGFPRERKSTSSTPLHPNNRTYEPQIPGDLPVTEHVPHHCSSVSIQGKNSWTTVTDSKISNICELTVGNY